MYKRRILDNLIKAASKLPVAAILGPKQSGKTTLVKSTFKDHNYVSLEDLDIRALAVEDPRKFFELYCNETGIILDEIQNALNLLSYIQTIVDIENKPGYFIITGSQNILLNQAISQTLAGRIIILTLLPLSIRELKENNILPEKLEELVFKGSYPRIYYQDLEPTLWYPSYIATYIERDVRSISNIEDILLFKRFLGLCAGRTGQLLNITSLANDTGINLATARKWLALLEQSYIIFLLQPHYKNFSKRLVKSPKLYFYDTELACSLLQMNL